VRNQTKIIGFLQNAWFREPERVRQLYEKYPEQRERIIASFLFMGCLTGQRLQKVFGEDLCRKIIWEEASRNIGERSSSQFPADINHITAVLEKHKPIVVLAFGKIVSVPLAQLKEQGAPWHLIIAPHPAARNCSDQDLKKVLTELKQTQITAWGGGRVNPTACAGMVAMGGPKTALTSTMENRI